MEEDNVFSKQNLAHLNSQLTQVQSIVFPSNQVMEQQPSSQESRSIPIQSLSQ